MPEFVMEIVSACTSALVIYLAGALFTMNKKINDLYEWHTKKDELMIRKVQDLHEWHDKEDELGVKVWYTKKNVEDAITRLTAMVERIDRREEINLMAAERHAEVLEKHSEVIGKLIIAIERLIQQRNNNGAR